MKEIDELVATLEIVCDAVNEKNSEKGFEVVTVFLVQYMDVFGHSPEIVTKTMPILEQLKDFIRSGAYDDAYPIVLALLVKLRSASKLSEE